MISYDSDLAIFLGELPSENRHTVQNRNGHVAVSFLCVGPEPPHDKKATTRIGEIMDWVWLGGCVVYGLDVYTENAILLVKNEVN